MKNKIIFFIAFFVCCVIISDFLTNYALTYNSWGGTPAHTGSPFDGQTCQGAVCHASSVPVKNGGTVTSNIPASGYIPGATYSITASIMGASNEFGFQASPQNSSGMVGSLQITNNTETQFSFGNNRYITHTQIGSSGSGSKSWTFNWTAPASGTGNVTFYAAFLITNNNNAATGDTTKTTSTTVSEDLSTKDITSFRFNALNPQVIGTIDPNSQNINLTVPYGTNVTNLAPTIAHIGASVNPPSGTANNFSTPQNYTVTAQNGTTKAYTVTVTVELNSSKDITTFNFSGLNPQVVGTINNSAQTINLTVPDGTDLTNLVPTIVHTGTGINPPSGAANDFSSPQDYIVTAGNGSTKTYSVIVAEAGNAKNITSFKLSGLNPEVDGIINEVTQSIDLTVPYGTDLTNLVPTISHTGDSINPASGIVNDFSSPKIYTVWANNASTKTYTVSVDIDSTGVAVTGQSLKQSFEIYPNPVADFIYLKQSSHYKFIRISIINKNGMTLKVFTTLKSIERFDISDLSPGIYFIKAETEKERIIKKIVKR